MKSSKRIKIILSAAVVIVGLLTGCAEKDGENVADENIVTESPTTEVPEVTEAPKATEVPEVTEAPEATEVPEETEEPQVTEAPEETEVPKVTEEPDTTDLSDWSYADYVTIGEYEDIKIEYDAIDAYVGDVYVYLPYYDETYMTERTIFYYYTLMNIEVDFEDIDSFGYIDDEEIAKLEIPGITGFRELKDFVVDKVNENGGIISMMIVGDAYMDILVKRSEYKNIPKQVIGDCEKIYSDYLSEMDARCNDIGLMPDVYIGEAENVAEKILAAMAFAKENGLDEEGFSYAKVMKYIYLNF